MLLKNEAHLKPYAH